jgi:5-methylthioadenosine/S-adenosylhomocysteine deaminase
MQDRYSISGVSIVTPAEFIENESIQIANRLIDGLGTKADLDFNGKGLYLYPALVNIHDHFRGNYLPKVGPKNGTFYLNWSYWDNDLHSAPVFEEREKNSIEDLYLLSAYKNVFSGVATVNDHFPHALNDPLIPGLPLHVIKEYALEHSAQSFSLKWGDGIGPEHKKAIEKNYPFIIHCEEGFDEETQGDIDRLIKLKCLDDHAVLIHCIGFSDKDIERVRHAGANVVWCPGSNMFMFNVTAKIKKMLEEKINVSLGTDSTHSGSANMLEEIRFARKTYKDLYAEELSAKTIVDMVTVNPSKALRMADKIGSIRVGKNADVLVIKPRKKDPYEALVECRMEDIELLTLNSAPLYGSAAYKELFTLSGSAFTQVKVRGTDKLVIGDPTLLIKRIRENVGFDKVFDFIPIDN